MLEDLSGLLTLQRKLNGPALAGYPDVERLRFFLQKKIEQAVARIVPQCISGLERKHGWSQQFHKAFEIYEQWGLFRCKEAMNALMSGKEVRDGAPGIGDVLEAFKTHPELLVKVKQGLVKVHPFPYGLSPTAFKEPMSSAILQYHSEGKLRSTDGTKLIPDVSEPVWISEVYEGADKNGSLVYSPQRFKRKNHGGKTKRKILEDSQFPGWQVLLVEDLKDIPYQGKGQTVGGRMQIEANHTPRQYLKLLRLEGHALERGLTLEAWQAMWLTHLVETDGEVLEDVGSNAACYCTDAYLPSYDGVPRVFWDRECGQVCVGWGGSRYQGEGDGSRVGVMVL